jgi:SAM-dependent methyltransferase
MQPFDRLHSGFVFPRRVRRLVALLADILPVGASALDVGCGDGQIDQSLLEKRPDLRIEGTDVLVRRNTAIPVVPFDGAKLPHADKSFDVVMFVDVLHHTDDPKILLREAVRVARQALVIKDHYLEGFFAGPRLRFMDYVGNSRFGVRLPYNYWSRKRWSQALTELRVAPAQEIIRLGLYPWPFDYLFGASLHFLVKADLQS